MPTDVLKNSIYIILKSLQFWLFRHLQSPVAGVKYCTVNAVDKSECSQYLDKRDIKGCEQKLV